MRVAVLSSLCLLVLIAACGDSPVQPGPVPPPPPPPPPANQVPVIASVVPGVERTEVESDVTITASVQDAETPVEQLRFEWKAPVGTFDGTGAVVRWRAPKGTVTPADVVVQLTVTETYGTADASGARPQHVVSGSSTPIRLHDSARETADLALGFLNDFANSSVAPAVAVRMFTDSCAGKQAELEDVQKNREHYRITGSSLSVRDVSLNGDRTRATVRAPCTFQSTVIKCHPEIPNCVVGMNVVSQGLCTLTARYEQRTWWLCDSSYQQFLGRTPLFFGRGD